MTSVQSSPTEPDSTTGSVPTRRRALAATVRAGARLTPEHARHHNRALVLQSLYRGEGLSRADLAREVGLTRVTISDLIADLITRGHRGGTGRARRLSARQARHGPGPQPPRFQRHRGGPIQGRRLPRSRHRPRRHGTAPPRSGRHGAHGPGRHRRGASRYSTPSRPPPLCQCSASAWARPASSTTAASCSKRPTWAGSTFRYKNCSPATAVSRYSSRMTQTPPPWPNAPSAPAKTT